MFIFYKYFFNKKISLYEYFLLSLYVCYLVFCVKMIPDYTF